MQQNTIHIFAKWQAKEGNIETILNLLPEVVKQSRVEKGNLKYEVFQSNEQPNTIILFESYVNQNALDFHRAASYFQDVIVGKVIPMLEKRSVEITQLLF